MSVGSQISVFYFHQRESKIKSNNWLRIDQKKPEKKKKKQKKPSKN